MLNKRGKAALLTIFLVLLFDQISKIWIKTHFMIGENIEIAPWFFIYFTENNGMAFGLELVDKLYLTLFRIVAVGFIAYYIVKQVKKSLPVGYIVTLSLILAGAAGNIIDSLFYGVFFTDSYGQVAQFLPDGGGYSSLFHGKVVDMLYFPLFRFNWPTWMPWIGGDDFLFFRPIFNIADSAITVGVILLLLFYRNYFGDETIPSSKKNK